MRRVLITGANKGIGLAMVEAILEKHDDVFVLLGSRNAERGEAAIAGLVDKNAAWADRVSLLEIDVASDDSVAKAAAHVAETFGTTPLYGVINNAGLGFTSPMKDVIDVNILGVRRVCEAFLPLIDPSNGRIVIATSASGPNFVSACSAERQTFLVNPDIEWEELSSFIDECLAIESGDGTFAEAGLGDGNAYGLSKACANAYTQLLARENPNLIINACTPGFIETDMTRPYATSQGKAPAEMGMKPPTDGTRSALFLLFGDPAGSGHYYGSDAVRSPIDRYRSPGDPPYTGD